MDTWNIAENFPYVLLSLLLVGYVIWIVIRLHRKPETDPIKLLMKQAASLKWKQTAEVKEDGESRPWMQRSVRFERGKELAILWYKDATVTLIRHQPTLPFDDFVELEQWIKKNPRDAEIEDAATGERLYLREIDRFIKIQGQDFRLMDTQATDEAFFMGFYKMYKAGYIAGEVPEVIAALILDALVTYEKDRGAALHLLTFFENHFKEEPPANKALA